MHGRRLSVRSTALLMATANQPGDRVNNAQKLLERMLWRRLEQRFPPLKAPVSDFLD